MSSKDPARHRGSLQYGHIDAEHLSVTHETCSPPGPTIQRGRPPSGWVFLAVFVPLFALFLSTARTDLPYHIDAATNVFTAWSIGTTGSPILSQHAELIEHPAEFAWVVASSRGPVSQYPPGAAFLAAPLYATVWQEASLVTLVASNAGEDISVRVPVPKLFPGAVVASATTAAALAFTALTVIQLGFSVRTAMLTAAISGLGTGAWSVAADALWQHGPNMMWVALGIYLACREKWTWAGIAFGALFVTRPPAVLIGIALGVMLLFRREWPAAGRLLIGTVPGVAALVVYNWWLFGTLTVSGGYGDAFAAEVVSTDLGWYLFNLVEAFIGPDIGLLVWSPFLALITLALVSSARQAPRWALAAAIGGACYLLLQLKANRASGGGGFSYYRYPLETLTALAPLLVVAWQQLWGTGWIAKIALAGTAGFAIVAHAVAAL